MTPRFDGPIRRRTGNDAELIDAALDLDGRNYGAYKSLIGDWDYGDFSLAIDHVQADPYAPPSAMRINVKPEKMGLPAGALETSTGRFATADFLARRFAQAIKTVGSRDLYIAPCGPEILQRSSVTLTPDHLSIRFQVQLPARGRSVMGRTAAKILDQDIPDVCIEVCDFISSAQKKAELEAHIATYEDYDALVKILKEKNWCAFVANGSVLARHSGVSQLPLTDAIAFESPESMQVTIDLPHAGSVSGMVIRPGITLIAGGGYHGKSTLLNAIERGVYAHVPGDGRELVATVPDAMKVRAADGRSVAKVDVSPFITHLPTGADTSRFSTANASGSTSQAASIMEAIELGSSLLLLDEDTSATNLLIRDSRMRALISDDREPITPLLDRISSLYRDRGVSVLMVMGGSGAYLDVADSVVVMDSYRAVDATSRAVEVTADLPRERGDLPFPTDAPSRIIAKGAGTSDRKKTKVLGTHAVQIDRVTVDLSDVEQIVDTGQTESIAWAIRLITDQAANGKHAIPDLLYWLERQMNSEGLDAFTKAGARQFPAFLVRPRRVDVGAALNRYRALQIVDESTEAGAEEPSVEATNNLDGE